MVLRLSDVRSGSMYNLSFEFDDLYSLVGQMGYKGSDIDTMVAFILHSINQTIRSELKKWNTNA